VKRLTKQHRRAIGEEVSSSESDSDEASDSDDDEEWNGVSPSPTEKVDREDEYIDEDKYTTVTIEEVNVDRDGLHAAASDSEDDTGKGQKKAEDVDEEEDEEGEKKKKRVWTKKKPPREQPKKKKAKFRYETKAERQVTRKIQHAKNSKQAKLRKSRGK
jgi:ribosomal RNA-processing protein 17